MYSGLSPQNRPQQSNVVKSSGDLSTTQELISHTLQGALPDRSDSTSPFLQSRAWIYYQGSTELKSHVLLACMLQPLRLLYTPAE